MKVKTYELLIILAIILPISLLFGSSVSANEMELLEYEIELQTDGSGIITETRYMYLDSGTEVYIIFDNLEGSEITDFHVSDFGESLTYEPDWDINASQEEKAGTYGMIETSDGVELAWGIGEYGYHEYTVEYTISDMVRSLEDGQGMNFEFFDGQDNVTPEEMTIRITGPDSFTTDDTLIWGFGFEGEVYLEDGDLVGWSNAPLSDSNHITILMQFLNEPFEPSLSFNQTLSEQQEIAMEGSDYDDSSMPGWVIFLIIFGTFLVLVLILTFFFVARARAMKRGGALIKGEERKKINEDKYYRQIPYEKGPITDIAYFLQEVGMGDIGDYFNAFMLKWLREGRISIKKEEIRGRFRSKEQTVIKLVSNEPFESEYERRFWALLEADVDADDILYEDDLSKLAQKKHRDITEISKDLSDRSEDYLIEADYLEKDEVAYLGNLTAKIIKGTDRGEALFNNIVQFKNFLDDFSLLSEREIKEVVLWDDLLIWASLYGIADKVAEELEQHYPSYFEEMQITYTDIYLMQTFSRNMQSGYSSSTSGGGGATSVGGGGGSIGGGGGGVR